MTRPVEKLKTTAVVTCHNYGRYLRQCLESLLHQTLPFDEIILVNDSSTDNTRSIWETYYAQQVRYLEVTEGCQKKARDAAIAVAAGDLIVCVDADDWLDSRYNEQMTAPFDRDELLGLAYCEQVPIRQDDHTWYPFVSHAKKEYDKYYVYRYNRFVNASMFRREAWPAVKRTYGGVLPDGKKFAEDWDVWLSILKQGWNVKLVPHKLIYYRIHGHNVTRQAVDGARFIEKFNDEVRARHLPYELTVIVLRPYMQSPMGILTDQLSRLDKPERTQIIIVENNPRPIHRHPLKPCCTEYIALPGEIEHLNTWTKHALKKARRKVLGRYVLVLDDRFSFGPDMYSGLRQSLLAKRADLVSARTLFYYSRRVLAWRAVQGSAANGLKEVYIARGVKRIAATDPVNVLMRYETFMIMEHKGNPVAQGWAEWAEAEGKRWFLDGRVRSSDRFRRREQLFPALKRRGSGMRGVPPVSIVIPVKNSERTLGLLLESLRKLEYPRDRLEIIVVDNASTDATASVARSFPEVILISEGKPSSYAARNAGIRKSRYEYIAFLDADCEVTPSWLRDLVAPLLEDSRLGLVGGMNRPVKALHPLSRTERAIGGYMNIDYKENWLYGYAITMNVIYRRAVFDQVGLFDDNVISGSDVEMSWRAQWQGKWRLRVLRDSGCVYHHDAVKVRSLIARHFRIGQGHYELYFKKYPPLMLDHYQWMPLRRWEIVLNTVKRWAGIEMQRMREGGYHRTKAEVCFNELRHMVQKFGFLKRLREEKAVQRKHAASRCIIHFGKRHFVLHSKAYEGLYHLSLQGRDVLYLNPARGTAVSWYSFFLALAGGTTVWHWSPRLKTMELWQLIPERFCKGRLAGLNDRINAWRIGRLLQKQRAESVLISGKSNLCRPDYFDRVPLLRNAAYLDYQALGAASNLQFPVIKAVFSRIDGSLDLDAYRTIARHLSWPVIFSGEIESGFRETFYAFLSESPLFYYFKAHEVYERLGNHEETSALALYCLKPDSGLLRSLPADFESLLEAGLPVFFRGPEHLRQQCWPGLKRFEDLKQLQLALNYYEQYPQWNLCLKGRSALNPSGNPLDPAVLQLSQLPSVSIL